MFIYLVHVRINFGNKPDNVNIYLKQYYSVRINYSYLDVVPTHICISKAICIQNSTYVSEYKEEEKTSRNIAEKRNGLAYYKFVSNSDNIYIRKQELTI